MRIRAQADHPFLPTAPADLAALVALTRRSAIHSPHNHNTAIICALTRRSLQPPPASTARSAPPSAIMPPRSDPKMRQTFIPILRWALDIRKCVDAVLSPRLIA